MNAVNNDIIAAQYRIVEHEGKVRLWVFYKKQHYYDTYDTFEQVDMFRTTENARSLFRNSERFKDSYCG